MTRPTTHFFNFREISLIILPTTLILLIPLVAMRFSAEVNWTGQDFLIAAVLIGGSLTAFRLLVGKSTNRSLKVAWIMFILTTLLLIWINLAVGLVGNERNPVNFIFYLVPIVGGLAAARARFRPAEMAKLTRGMGVGHALLGMAVFFLQHGLPWHILLLTLLFSIGWFGAAGRFRRSAGQA